MADEATVDLAWHLSVAVGWIKLQVAPSDVERAISILESTNLNYQSVEDLEIEATQEGNEESNDDIELNRRIKVIVTIICDLLIIVILWIILKYFFRNIITITTYY